MACNCATDEMIKALYKKYGEGEKESPKTFGKRVKKILTTIAVYIVMIPILAYLIPIILYKGLIKNEKINLYQLLSIYNGRQQ